MEKIVFPTATRIKAGDEVSIYENESTHFVLTVNRKPIAYSTHPQPLIQFVRNHGLAFDSAA